MYTFQNKQFVISWQSIKLTTKTCLSLVNQCIYSYIKKIATAQLHQNMCSNVPHGYKGIETLLNSITDRNHLNSLYCQGNCWLQHSIKTISKKEKSFFSYLVTMEYMKIHNYTYNIFNTHKSLSIMSILKTQGMHTYLEISY